MSPSGLHINKPAVIIIIGLVGAVIFWLNYSPTSSDKETIQTDTAKESDTKTTMDLTEELFAALKDEKVPEEKSLNVKEGLELKYREVSPPEAKFDVLFVHGMKFNAETWVSEPVYTLQLLNKLGYRAVALDLPEARGKSKKPSSTENGDFIKEAIAALQLDKPVIVSPSMSGGYSLPFLFKDPATVLERSRGFVPVAPVSTQTYVNKFKSAKIPTLIIFGANDDSIGPQSVKDLENLPDAKKVKLDGAGHACYMNKPFEFSKTFVEFLQGLK